MAGGRKENNEEGSGTIHAIGAIRRQCAVVEADATAAAKVSAPATVIGKPSQTSTCMVAMRGDTGGSADPWAPPLATAFHQRQSGMQEEVAEAYNIAVITFRGLNTVTNFDMSRYDIKSILGSLVLPVGSGAKRLEDAKVTVSWWSPSLATISVGPTFFLNGKWIPHIFF
uniref:AP2/ERF domain-containing protein n=1 Tax=Oryza meridionalis TaxID=40149 RepID=A0A0E0D308_9ORYZ